MKNEEPMNESQENDLLTFASEKEDLKNEMSGHWKILIVDDDMDVHRVTKLVLSGFEFGGKTLTLFSAFSAVQAKLVMEEHSDIAVILLDVVMEEEDSGLKLVKYIREEIGNSSVRIILRTGQPGQAPEQKVVLQYDINDYKAKTELTSEKLFTTVIASLRSYRDIITIEKSRAGLEKIIEASAGIFEIQSLKTFVSGMLGQFVSILQFGSNAFYAKTSALTGSSLDGKIVIKAATGNFGLNAVESDVREVIFGAGIDLIEKAVAEKKNQYDGHRYVGFFKSKTGNENIVYLERDEPLENWEKNMVDILCSNVSIAFENIYLNQKLEDLVDVRTHQLKEANSELSIKNNSIMKDLEMARRVQMSLMPATFPESSLISFAGRYMPMQDLGGDYYDVFSLGDEKYGLVMADVSGHGASASLITAMVKMFFLESIAYGKSTAEIINNIHSALFKTVGQTGIFVTVFYGIVDLSKMEMEYTNAGHIPIVILNRDGKIREIESNGTIVGVFANAEYISERCSLFHGDRIILLTDGISEALNADGNMIGLDAIKDVIAATTKKNAAEIADELFSKVLEHSTGSVLDDDRTILIADIAEQTGD